MEHERTSETTRRGRTARSVEAGSNGGPARAEELRTARLSSAEWDEAFVRAKGGDREAQEGFVQQGFQFLMGPAHSWVCGGLDRDEARGFICEAVAICFDEYRPEGGLRTFLSRTFANLVIDRWYRPRKDALGRRHAHRHAPIDDPDQGPAPIPASAESNPEAMLRLRLLERKIEAFARRLPDDDRLVLRLTIEGYQCHEIQAMLPGRSAKDIRYRLRRDLKAFLKADAKSPPRRRSRAA